MSGLAIGKVGNAEEWIVLSPQFGIIAGVCNLRMISQFLLISTIILVVTGCSLLRWTSQPIAQDSAKPSLTFSTNQQASSRPTPITGWKTYSDVQNGFVIEYPADWRLETRGIIQSTPEIVLVEGGSARNVYIEISQNENRLAYLRDGMLGNQVTFGGLSWETFLHPDENPGEFGDFRSTLVMLARYRDKYLAIRVTPNEGNELDPKFEPILNRFSLKWPMGGEGQ